MQAKPCNSMKSFYMYTTNTITCTYTHTQNNELQLKVTRSRNRSMMELDQGLQEKSEKFEREKASLMDQNKELRHELDKVTANYERVLANKQEQESELRELRQNKELLSQWERQIADIIQWVTEEKDARAYLKTMAKKLRDDVDNLKTTAGVLGRVCCKLHVHVNSWGGVLDHYGS